MTRVALAFMLLVVGPLEVTIAQSVLPDGAPVSQKKWIWQDAVPQTEPAPTRGNRSPYSVKGQTYTVLPTADDYVEEGVASWYGTKFHGRQTANGTTTASTDGRSRIAAAPPTSAPFETLLARWRLAPEAEAALAAPPPDPRARTVLLVGDSTMRLMAEALSCTLLRRRASKPATATAHAADTAGWKVEYLQFVAYRPGYKSSEANRREFEERLTALSSGGGGVVVLGIGLHYNNPPEPTQAGDALVEFRETM